MVMLFEVIAESTGGLIGSNRHENPALIHISVQYLHWTLSPRMGICYIRTPRYAPQFLFWFFQPLSQ